MPRNQTQIDQASLAAQGIKAKSQCSLLRVSIYGENSASKQRLIQHLTNATASAKSPSKKAEQHINDALCSTHLRQISVAEPSISGPLNTTADTDLAIFLIDTNTEFNNQLARQTRLLSLLNIKHVLLVVDTDEPALYEQASFTKTCQYFAEQIKNLHFTSVSNLPLSSLTGDNLQLPSTELHWHQGPSLYSWLDSLEVAAPHSERVVFTLDKVEQADNHTCCSGQLAEGRLKVGDVIRIARSGQTAQVAKVLTPHTQMHKATPSTALSLELDRVIEATPNDIISLSRLPLETTDQFEATLIWLDGEPGLIGRTYSIQLANQQTTATITNLKHRINLDNGTHEAHTKLERDDASLCTIATAQALVFDAYTQSKTLGSFHLLDKQSQTILAFGMLTHSLRRAQNVHTQALSVSATDRAQLNGHKGKVIWFTGLSGSGKSTIANALEVELHGLGYRTYLLDGDNVRQGLNKDLGFTDADRVENIRRIAEVAKLMLDAGLIVLTAFISPFRQERQMARELIGEDNFIEVYVSTSLQACEQRDVKGLYKKARAGQLPNLSGVGSPYEPPIAADININTEDADLKTGIAQLIKIIQADQEISHACPLTEKG